VPSILVNRAPVLTLWTAVVAERRGDPANPAVAIDRAVAGSAARVKARSIGREERKANRNATGTITGDAYATWMQQAASIGGKRRTEISHPPRTIMRALKP
jgi:enolase